LHDIGKLAVPEYIISKPGKLTPAEFEKMKTHTVVGAEILDQVRFPYAVAPLVRSHHEKWDGSGYPDGLAGEQIPMGSRILSAVDCLDALASDRQYRTALPLDEAIGIVRNEAGKSFDPRVVAVLAQRFVELESMAKSVGQAEKAKLSIDVKIERGAAPAAGFETARSSDDNNRDLLSFNNSIQEAGRQARALADLSDELERCQDRPAVFAVLRTEMRQLIPYDLMVVYGLRGDHLEPECLEGEDQRVFSSLEIPVGMGLSGWVAENAKSILNGNPSVEPGYLNDPTKFTTLRSALAVPLESDGSVKGVLSLYRQERDAFTREHLSMLLSFGVRLARVIYAPDAVQQGSVERR
jgi:putative methionine-R-sulfoxide reductase with GAF domain